jgi:hypothetical protein
VVLCGLLMKASTAVADPSEEFIYRGAVDDITYVDFEYSTTRVNFGRVLRGLGRFGRVVGRFSGYVGLAASVLDLYHAFRGRFGSPGEAADWLETSYVTDVDAAFDPADNFTVTAVDEGGCHSCSQGPACCD